MSAKWKRNTVVLVMAVLVCAAVALNWKYTIAPAGNAIDAGKKLLGEAALVSNATSPSGQSNSSSSSSGSGNSTKSTNSSTGTDSKKAQNSQDSKNTQDTQNSNDSKDSENPETNTEHSDGQADENNQDNTDSTAMTEAGVYSGSDYFASARLTRQQARDNAISLLQSAAEQEDASQELADQASAGIQVLAGYTMKEAQIESLVAAKGYTDCVAFMGDDSISVVVSTDSGELTAEDVAKITDIAVNETGYPVSGVKIMPAN